LTYFDHLWLGLTSVPLFLSFGQRYANFRSPAIGGAAHSTAVGVKRVRLRSQAQRGRQDLLKPRPRIGPEMVGCDMGGGRHIAESDVQAPRIERID